MQGNTMNQNLNYQEQFMENYLKKLIVFKLTSKQTP